MNNNPCAFGANEMLRMLDPHRPTTRHEVEQAASYLASSLGTTVSPVGLDNGTMALVLICQFLKEYGGTIHALTLAHNELHQP